MLSRLKDIVKHSIQYACIMHCTFEYVADFVVCNGPSMEPTLFSKNILLTERISPRFHNPHRGDIIIAVSPVNPQQHICKRIVGLPGDKIITKSSKIAEDTPKYNDDQEENAINDITETFRIIDKYVPRGFVWIEGDNSSNSSDSRYYGPIPLGLVKSRVVCRLWPLGEFKLLL